MKTEELLNALSTMNINSDTAEVIMGQYMQYKYVELASNSLIMAIFAVGLAVVINKIIND